MREYGGVEPGCMCVVKASSFGWILLKIVRRATSSSSSVIQSARDYENVSTAMEEDQPPFSRKSAISINSQYCGTGLGCKGHALPCSY